MEPNFETGQLFIANKVIYKFDDIKRMNIVILSSPTHSDVHYIKRIIGLPGETVEIKNGLVYMNDVALSEPNVLDSARYTMKKLSILKGYYFVLGDNRNNNNDFHV